MYVGLIERCIISQCHFVLPPSAIKRTTGIWSGAGFVFFEGLFIQGVSMLCISRNLKQLRLSFQPERCPGLGNYNKHAFIWTWGEGACFCASGLVAVMFLGWAVGVGWRPVGNVDCKLSAFNHMTRLQLFCDRTHLVWPSSTPKFYRKLQFLSVSPT